MSPNPQNRLRRVETMLTRVKAIRVLRDPPAPEIAELERFAAERGYPLTHEEALAEMDRLEAAEVAS